MLPRSREALEDVDTWQVVIVSDPRHPLPRNAQILRLIDPERRVEYVIGKPAVLVGQSPLADLVLDWPGVLRSHCRLEWRQDRWWIFEWNTEADLSINGSHCRESELLPDDLLTIADRTLEVDQIAVRELV